jgi:hypothetical protein
MRTTPTAFLCLALVLATGLACAGMKKPWRDYTAKPFNSAEWLAGDHIERGRMAMSMYRNTDVHIANQDEARQTLGEPDIKKTVENKEVWLYRIDLGFGPDGRDVLPVSFDRQGRGSMGVAKGGTMSIVAKESEL